MYAGTSDPFVKAETVTAKVRAKSKVGSSMTRPICTWQAGKIQADGRKKRAKQLGQQLDGRIGNILSQPALEETMSGRENEGIEQQEQIKSNATERTIERKFENRRKHRWT
jgi:hypothetical protein